jgi:uncharacterized protein (DUF433 family)/DNA-binding transcriptional MerR regulator
MQSGFGLGAYTVPEASRLLGLEPSKIRLWSRDYSHRDANSVSKSYSNPLWARQYQSQDGETILGFKDLIELKIVGAFLTQGVSLKTVRKCLQEAREVIEDSHPFTTLKFKSDGATLFLDQRDIDGKESTLDLKNKQFVIRKVMEQSFHDLDIEDNVVASWRPYKGKSTIVVDPSRSFGQPITNEYGIATSTLVEAVQSEGSLKAVSRLYEIPIAVVRDAVGFEEGLGLH